jgi:DNA-binding NarL/FixJ family response regulator
MPALARFGIEIRRPERVKAKPKVRPKVDRPDASAAIAARREAVRGLIEAEEYAMEIARRLGIAPRTVVGDARAMGLKLARGCALAKPQSEAAAKIHRLRSERREHVARLHAQGLSIAAISQAVGIAPRTVRQDLQSQGLKYISSREVLAQGRAGRTVAILSKIAARDLRLRALVAEGRRATEICAALGIAESTVRRDLSRLGLRIAENTALEQRRAQVARMRADGATIPQMAQALGVSPAAISSDIAALGLAGKNNSPKRMAA